MSSVLLLVLLFFSRRQVVRICSCVVCITIIVQYDLTVTSLIGTIIRAACDKRNGSQLTAITISKSHFTTCNLQNKCITAVCCDFSRLVLFVTSFVGLLVWNTFYKVWATSAKDVLSTKVSSFHYYLCCYYYFWQSSRHSPQKRVRQYCICKMAKLTYSAKSAFSPLWNVVCSVPSKKIYTEQKFILASMRLRNH